MQSRECKKTFTMSPLVVILLICFSQVWGSYENGHRIVGGQEATLGQYPFAVGIIYYTSEGRHFCGGSIIDRRWILTAAHCMENAIEFEIYLGINKLDEASNSGVVMRATRYVAYEEYNATSLEHDIGLISLTSDITYNDRIQPVDLPTSSLNQQVETIAIGWGATTDDQNRPTNELQHVKLTTIANAICRRTYGGVVTENVVCATGVGSQGICGGDSGGPLVEASEGKYVQVGITSFYSAAGCETSHPSGFTRTFEYREWIRHVTGDGNNLSPTVPYFVVTVGAILVSVLLSV